jgi:hypothetical protein
MRSLVDSAMKNQIQSIPSTLSSTVSEFCRILRVDLGAKLNTKTFTLFRICLLPDLAFVLQYSHTTVFSPSIHKEGQRGEPTNLHLKKKKPWLFDPLKM